jgi:protein SERAC1
MHSTSAEANIAQEFLQSLEFPGMTSRQGNIQTALDDTCEWLYQTPQYIEWIHRKRIVENQGLLWIKGKPGSGKSTLMKNAFQRADTLHRKSQTTVVGFFFNARSTEALEKTPLGLYRSFLHQVIRQDDLALNT